MAMPEISIVLDVHVEAKDWCLTHEEVDAYCREVENSCGIDAKVLSYAGPGGGNPEIKFTGPYDRVEHFYIEVYSAGDPQEEMDLYLTP